MPIELNYAALHAIGFAASAALCALLWAHAASRRSNYRRTQRISDPLGRRVHLDPRQFPALHAAARRSRCGRNEFPPCRDAGMEQHDLGPIAIGRFLQAGIGTASRASRAFLMFTGAVVVVNLGLMTVGRITHAFDLDASWYPKAVVLPGPGVTAIALILYRVHRHEPAAGRSHRSRAGSAAACSCSPPFRSRPPCSACRIPGCPPGRAPPWA